MLPIKVLNVSLSLVFSQIVCYLNFYLLFSIFFSKRISRKTDLIIIYYRFAIDMVYSFIISLVQAYYLIRLIDAELVIKNMLFFLTYPANICTSIRPTLVFLICFDRVVAVYSPVLYHNNRHRISSLVILPFMILSAALDQYIWFGYCGDDGDVPLECDEFSCTVNECYFNYWLSHEQATHFINAGLTLVLFFRLFIYNRCTNYQSSKVITKATRIALLDSIILISFNIFPSFIFKEVPSISFKTVGPLVVVFKTAGLLIETIVICKYLINEKIAHTVTIVLP